MDQRKRTTTTEKSENYIPKNHAPTYSPVTAESKSSRPIKILRNYNNNNPKESRHVASKKDWLEEDLPEPRLKSVVDSVDENNSIRRKISVQKKTENYVEKDGTLLVPEQKPYFYNEKAHDTTENPGSDTKKINVREYRNRVESIKLSELKHIRPEGTVQFVNYERYV